MLIGKEIKILYEDRSIVVLLKPAGLSVHSDGKTKDETLVDVIVSWNKKMESVGEPFINSDGLKIKRSGIVHRLDKDTSGAIIVAKNNKAFDLLKSQFKNREIKKTYIAFVSGKLKDERGQISKQIGRAIGSVRKWAVPPKTRGELRDAVTKYKSLNFKDGVSLVELWPLTGRTHQIRVHMASIGHPVLHDPLYSRIRDNSFGFDRLALHAFKISFKNTKGEDVVVYAPFPDDFQKAIGIIGSKDRFANSLAI